MPGMMLYKLWFSHFSIDRGPGDNAMKWKLVADIEKAESPVVGTLVQLDKGIAVICEMIDDSVCKVETSGGTVMEMPLKDVEL